MRKREGEERLKIKAFMSINVDSEFVILMKFISVLTGKKKCAPLEIPKCKFCLFSL